MHPGVPEPLVTLSECSERRVPTLRRMMFLLAPRVSSFAPRLRACLGPRSPPLARSRDSCGPDPAGSSRAGAPRRSAAPGRSRPPASPRTDPRAGSPWPPEQMALQRRAGSSPPPAQPSSRPPPNQEKGTADRGPGTVKDSIAPLSPVRLLPELPLPRGGCTEDGGRRLAGSRVAGLGCGGGMGGRRPPVAVAGVGEPAERG